MGKTIDFLKLTVFGVHTTNLSQSKQVSKKINRNSKFIHPKYSKHSLSTVAHTIDCVCSKILNHGLNHGLLFSLFKFFG